MINGNVENPATAVTLVLTRNRLDFGKAIEIARLAEAVVGETLATERIAANLPKWYRFKKPTRVLAGSPFEAATVYDGALHP
jgi:hypothetical protein